MPKKKNYIKQELEQEIHQAFKEMPKPEVEKSFVLLTPMPFKGTSSRLTQQYLDEHRLRVFYSPKLPGGHKLVKR